MCFLEIRKQVDQKMEEKLIEETREWKFYLDDDKFH